VSQNFGFAGLIGLRAMVNVEKEDTKVGDYKLNIWLERGSNYWAMRNDKNIF